MARVPVIHIVSALPTGGVETSLLQMLPRLKRKVGPIEVVVIREEGELAPRYREAGIPVTLCKVASRFDPGSILRLANLLKEREASIVHTHLRRPNTTGRLAAWWAKTPLVFATEHNMGGDKTWKHYWIDRWLARGTDKVICVSENVKRLNQTHSGIAEDQFRVIYNGVDLAAYNTLPTRDHARHMFRLPADAPLIGFVGRLHPIKNLPAIIEAMGMPPLEKAHLVIAGGGRDELEREYRRLASENPAKDRIHFLGWVGRPRELYPALDCVVMASDSEGLPMVQLEALASQTPLVSTPVGFAGEVLTHDKEYLQVSGPDSMQLANALARALEPETARRLSQAGRLAVEAMSVEEQATQVADLYREVCAAKQVPFPGEEIS